MKRIKKMFDEGKSILFDTYAGYKSKSVSNYLNYILDYICL